MVCRMFLHIRRIALLLACLLCTGCGRRVQIALERWRSDTLKAADSVPSPQSLVEQRQSNGQGSATGVSLSESPWNSPDVQRVLMLLCITVVGFSLRGRFQGKDSNAVQKVLLQFLVPATLFKGLSKEKIEMSHMAYLGSGVLLILVRTLSSLLVSYTALGRSPDPALAKLRRTAIFEISTTASALSVLPFISEFLGPEFVGLGGMVDLPMKMYMLVMMPLLLKAFGEKTSASAASTSQNQGGQLLAALAQLLKDPITMSLIFGIVTAVLTDGQGSKALGFVGKAIDTLAGAQTPVLFLLIGLKLNIESSMPFICLVLLLANQGIMLIVVSIFLRTVSLGEDMTKFVILFSQGAPSVVGLGVMVSTINSGVQGYSTDFAFDIVGMAFPISSVFQCVSGLAGASYAHHLGIVGPTLIAIAFLLRVVFNRRFEEASVAKTTNDSTGA